MLDLLQKLANQYASKPAAGKRKRGAADPALQGQEGIPADLHLQMAAAAAAAAYQVISLQTSWQPTAQGPLSWWQRPRSWNTVFWLPDSPAHGGRTGSSIHAGWRSVSWGGLKKTWPETVPPDVHQHVAFAVTLLAKLG